MEKEELLRVLYDWNFWEKDLETGVPRPFYADHIKDLLDDVGIVTEIGLRRSGKSFIARQVAKRLIDGGTDRRDILIIDVNDYRLARDGEMLASAYSAYVSNIKTASKRKPLVIIDEAQEIGGWERFVRSISEKHEAKFIVTGSSSKLLSSEFSTLLGGRHISVEVLPLSFREFLGFKGINPGSTASISRDLGKIEKALDDYMEFGGLPAVVLAKHKAELLNSYIETIIVKDVAARYGVRDIAKLETLVRFYLSNISHSITYNSIAKFTRIPVKTVERLSGNLANAFLIFFVKRFSFSVKEQENSPRKIYSIDIGLSYAVGLSIAMGRGAVLENVVAVELKRRRKEFYYWKESTTGNEIDFIIVEKNGSHALLQVADNIDAKGTFDREVRGLEKAMGAFKEKRGILILRKLPYERTMAGLRKKGITAVSLWKWLLEGA
jgi:hypothetical protein